MSSSGQMCSDFQSYHLLSICGTPELYRRCINSSSELHSISYSVVFTLEYIWPWTNPFIYAAAVGKTRRFNRPEMSVTADAPQSSGLTSGTANAYQRD